MRRARTTASGVARVTCPLTECTSRAVLATTRTMGTTAPEYAARLTVLGTARVTMTSGHAPASMAFRALAVT